MLKKAAIFGLAGVMAVAAGCGSNKDAGNANNNEAKIALLTTTTGGAAAYGESIKAGAELAVSEINADANNVKINLLVEDTKGDKNEAINAMNKVISKDKVVGVIGPMLSGEMMAAGPVQPHGSSSMIVGARQRSSKDTKTKSGYRLVGGHIILTSLSLLQRRSKTISQLNTLLHALIPLRQLVKHPRGITILCRNLLSAERANNLTHIIASNTSNRSIRTSNIHQLFRIHSDHTSRVREHEEITLNRITLTPPRRDRPLPHARNKDQSLTVTILGQREETTSGSRFANRNTRHKYHTTFPSVRGKEPFQPQQ